MRFEKILLVSLVVAALASCDSHSATPSSTLSPSTAATGPEAPPPSPASSAMTSSARSAATQFYRLYFSRNFSASWDLLAPAAKREIPRNIWVAVHGKCLPDSTRMSGTIKSVTVFGKAAIVSESITGAAAAGRTVATVFNYASGRWGYSPSDLSIYKHGSVSADLHAARKAGYCAGRNNAIL